MTISIDGQNIRKNLIYILMKILSKPEIKGNFLDLIKDIYRKLSTYLIMKDCMHST